MNVFFFSEKTWQIFAPFTLYVQTCSPKICKSFEWGKNVRIHANENAKFLQIGINIFSITETSSFSRWSYDFENIFTQNIKCVVYKKKTLRTVYNEVLPSLILIFIITQFEHLIKTEKKKK